MLGVKRFFGVTGNHDLDSRYLAPGTLDPKEALRALQPPYPVPGDNCNAANTSYWLDHFAVLTDTGVRAVLIDTCGSHGLQKDEMKHGRISTQTLHRIRKHLQDDGDEYAINLAICHHHPQQHSELELGEYDFMRDGQQFLQLIGSGEFGSWIVIHGHKHHPKITYAAGGNTSPVVFSAGSFSVLLEGAEPDSFQPHPDFRGITLGYRPDGQLFRANSGPKGGHFSICRICGNAKRAPGAHKKPWGPDCSGGRITADLVFEFRTDTLQLPFDGVRPAPPGVGDRSFWLSLQTGFIAAVADTLVIPRRDLDGTYRSQGEGSSAGELVVYDRVPGGAGYVGRIRQELPRILNSMLERVRNCPNPACEPAGSCYACLRTYGNQFNWDILRRDGIADWLGAVLTV
jgi:hypothetical protein